jgi:hypothetical protein
MSNRSPRNRAASRLGNFNPGLSIVQGKLKRGLELWNYNSLLPFHRCLGVLLVDSASSRGLPIGANNERSNESNWSFNEIESRLEPRMSRSGDLPTAGSPNSSREKRDKKGKIVQRRYYDGEGKAILNIDYDHDHGAGIPHGHDWDRTHDPPVRLPGRRLTAREKTRSK